MSTQTRNTYFEPIQVRISRNSYLNGVKAVIYRRLQDSLLEN